jgi:hypothetical protein
MEDDDDLGADELEDAPLAPLRRVDAPAAQPLLSAALVSSFFWAAASLWLFLFLLKVLALVR